MRGWDNPEPWQLHRRLPDHRADRRVVFQQERQVGRVPSLFQDGSSRLTLQGDLGPRAGRKAPYRANCCELFRTSMRPSARAFFITGGLSMSTVKKIILPNGKKLAFGRNPPAPQA